MDASQYAFVHGVRATRSMLASWNRHPWKVLRVWLAGSFAAASLLLLAVWAIAAVAPGKGGADLTPPIAIGLPRDVVHIFFKNMLVLGLHAMACVAGFIAGSSLPMQAHGKTGVSRWIHEHGGRFAILFVIAATTFSPSAQAYVLGTSVANCRRLPQLLAGPAAARSAATRAAGADRAVPAAGGVDHREP